MSIAVDFYKGTYQEYFDQRNNHNDNALYFCTDKQIMFKGKSLIGKPYQRLDSLNAEGLPNIQLPIDDIFYLYDDKNLIFAHENGEWIKIFGNHICSIKHFNDTFNIVAWNPTTRLLTLPQVLDPINGNVNALEINLGKDLILESGSYYDTTSKTIRLKLAVPDPDDSGDEDISGEYIDIPVGDLVDIYEVDDTASINLTLALSASTEEAEKDINKYTISASVKIASVGNEEKPNALVEKTTGLYVDVETYADGKCQESKDYAETRLGTSSDLTVQSLLDKKANIENPTLNNPVLNAPILNGAAIENDSLEVKENDLWSSTDYDNRVVSVKMIKDFIETENTWGAIARISTWGDLNNNEGGSL